MFIHFFTLVITGNRGFNSSDFTLRNYIFYFYLTPAPLSERNLHTGLAASSVQIITPIKTNKQQRQQ